MSCKGQKACTLEQSLKRTANVKVFLSNPKCLNCLLYIHDKLIKSHHVLDFLDVMHMIPTSNLKKLPFSIMCLISWLNLPVIPSSNLATLLKTYFILGVEERERKKINDFVSKCPLDFGFQSRVSCTDPTQ